MPGSSLPSVLQRSDRRGSILFGLRLLLAADLGWLLLRRWHSLDASLQTLEVEGFPAPDLWLATAMLAGGIGVVTLLLGWRVRWGAASAMLIFMPFITVLNASYVPTGWAPWVGTLLLFLVLLENIALGFALTGIFFFGAGRYTLSRGIRAGQQWLCSVTSRLCVESVSGTPRKKTAHR